MKPLIAIVGRPNVGKSTIFNRLIGRRKAIVNDASGVTRDRHYGDADWGGKFFRVVDTGGLIDLGSKAVEAQIKKQTLAAIDEADLILCVLDGKSGPTFLDQQVITLLRRSSKPILWVVNKSDQLSSANKDSWMSPFYELGLSSKKGGQTIFPVSAEHGRGFDDLLDAITAKIPEMQLPDEVVDEDTPHIAIIGRPNAGKSTLINSMLGHDRVIVHDQAGTTRDTIDVKIEAKGKKYLFVDTAGLKKKSKTIESLDKFSTIKKLDAIERANIVLLMIDSNEGFTHQDSYLLDYAYNLGKGIIVLFNKWDALKTDAKELIEFYRAKLMPMHRVPFLCISAKKKTNIEAVFAEVDRVFGCLHKKFSTAELNRMLEDFVASHNIPSHQGKVVKFYYVTQVGGIPPNFVIFSNRPEHVASEYKRYLINRLQEMIGDGVPVRIRFRKK